MPKTRKGNGEGSLCFHKATGRWYGRYYVDTPNGPKRRTTPYFKTRKEAAKALAEAIANRDKGLVFDAGSMSVGEYLERWLADSVRGSVAHSTYSAHRQQTHSHLIPVLGKHKLKNLKAVHIQSLYRQKLDAGLKPSTVRRIHNVLHRALGQAVKGDLIPRNPADAVDPPKVSREEMTPLDAGQAKLLLDAAAGDPYEALYVLSVECGLRRGEALGLRWSDVDLDEGKLRVERQLQRVRRDGDTPGRLEFAAPKHNSRRTINLPQRTVRALKSHRARQLEQKLRAGAMYDDAGLVFATATGRPLDAQNVVNRHFKPLLKRAGLPDIRWHDLRHTTATLLLAKPSTHPTYVQRLLGHSSISLTLDTYSHWMPGMGEHTATAMNDLWEDDAGEAIGE